MADITTTGAATPLLKTRRFAPLFWVQALGAFNDQVFKTGFLVLLTYRLAAEMGLNASLHNTIAGALFIIPFALVSPTAGMVADGVDKARMMRVVKALEIGLMIVGAIAFHAQSLALLYGLLFLMGAQSALFAPIKYGILPQYLGPQELARGNGLIQAATFLAILLGQIVGAKLVLTAYGITAISMGVIAVAILGFVASLYAPAAPPVGTPPRVDWVLPRAMWGVVREGRKVPGAFRAILGIAWFWFTGAAFLALLPPYALEGLHGTNGVFVLLLSTFSVGVAIGALLCARIFGERPAVPMAAWGAGGDRAGRRRIVARERDMARGGGFFRAAGRRRRVRRRPARLADPGVLRCAGGVLGSLRHAAERGVASRGSGGCAGAVRGVLEHRRRAGDGGLGAAGRRAGRGGAAAVGCLCAGRGDGVRGGAVGIAAGAVTLSRDCVMKHPSFLYR